MKKRIVVLFSVFLLLLPALASAEPEAGNWEFSVSGSGANNSKFSSGFGTANLSLGFFIAKPLELSIRQSGTYQDLGFGPVWLGTTRGALDIHFPYGKVWPFVGGNIGASYGSRGANNTWEGAPEAGIKAFFNENTFLLAQAEYQFFFHKGTNVGTNFKNGQFVYTVGVGFLF